MLSSILSSLIAVALLPSVTESTSSDFNATACAEGADTHGMVSFCANGEPRLIGIEGAKAFVADNKFAKRFGVMTEKSAKCLVSDPVKGSKNNNVRAMVRHCFNDLLAPSPEFDNATKLSMLARGVTECDPSYTTCEADVVPACHFDMPCKRFDAAIKDLSLEKLLLECGGLPNIKHFGALLVDKQFRATAKCDQQAKAVDPEHHCWLPTKEAGHDVTIGVPVYSPTWWANVVLAYLAFGVEGVARMPACRLPSKGDVAKGSTLFVV